MSTIPPSQKAMPKGKLSKDGGLRTPRVTEDASRGLNLDFKVPTPLPKTSEEFIRRFGPLTVEIQQAITAILMLDSPESNIVIDSLNALQKFCKKRQENKEFYVELGGLIPVQKRMFDNHTVIQRMCMKILALVSTVHKTKLFIRDLQLYKDLFTLADTKDDVIVEYATKALSNLATLHTGRLQITQQPKGIPSLITLLTHQDPDIQRNALETIWQLAADPLHLFLVTGKPYVEAIIKLVDSEYPPLQALALMTLEKIAQRPDGSANLESLGATAVLARKLTNETMVDLHRHCLRIFYHECKDKYTCRKFAFLAPAIVDVVERTPDAVAKVNGLELLGRLCSLELVAKGLAESGMPNHLCSLLTQQEAEQAFKEACALLIAQIARSAYSSKKEFSKCIPALLNMVRNESTSRKGVERSLIALSSILEDISSSMDEFNKANGFDVLRKLMENPDKYSDDAILSALNCIDIIAGTPSQRNAVVEAKFLPILLKLVKPDQNKEDDQQSQEQQGQQRRKQSAQRKESKAKIAESQSQAAQEVGTEPSTAEPLNQSQQLTQSQTQFQNVDELPDPPPTEDLASGAASGVQTAATATTTSISAPPAASGTGSKISQLSQPKAPLEKGPTHYSNNPQIHAATCSILCSLLCEPSTHEEFGQQKGPEVVLNMMTHNEFPVVAAAVSIINVACANPSLGKVLLEKGLLQTMWKRSDLINVNGPLRGAFNRLMSSDLSLKYSVTGQLSPFERVKNGFCDMGRLNKLEELKLPQDFTWEKRATPKQKIFLLNLAPVELDSQIVKNNESVRTMQDQGQDLQDILESIQAQKESIDSEPNLVGIIAKAVSDRFGGPLDKWRFTANSEDIEVENLQNQYKSLIVPISFLTTGTYRVRALVFKAICDLFGIPCSLETGDYRKTWNVVLLRPDERFPRMCTCPDETEKQAQTFVYTDSLRKYVVDLVFQPGTLLPLGSFDSETYITSS